MHGRVLVIKYNKEYHLQCPIKGCTYHERESNYKPKHNHSTASNNLSQYYEKTGTIEQTYKKLRAEFTAEANLSSNFVTKPFFKDFICSISEFAFQYARNHSDIKNFPPITSFVASENTKTIFKLNQFLN